MIRFLDGLVLLKEVDSIEGGVSSDYLKENYSDKIVVIRHVSYIYATSLCDVSKESITLLDNYIQIGELADRMSIRVESILDRISIMKVNPQRIIFDFIEVCGMYFVKIDREFRYLLENFQPFSVKLWELKNPEIQVKMLGDIKIGFY